MSGTPATTTREFWAWAIEQCEARIPILSRWFPGLKRNSLQHNKLVAMSEFQDLPWPKLTRAKIDYSAFPKEPPAGWPTEQPEDSSGSESTELMADGSCRSLKFLEMTEAQSKDPVYLLDAHGFDTSVWELVSAKNKIWHGFSKDKEGEPQRTVLFASSITAKPRVRVYEIDDLVAALRTVERVKVTRPRGGRGLLELAHTDMHFGNSDFAWYEPSLQRTLDVIAQQPWAEILVWIGSDLFHCDNFKNTTSNGTLQSSVNWSEAWADATRFYGTVIEAALEHGKRVSGKYIIGNHDESMAWAFCQGLAWKYPQLTFDTAIEERKVHVFGRCAIGMTHGDNRTRKDLDRIFMAEFPTFAAAAHREVHAGHLHHELSTDEYGVVSRSISTAARTDKWHREEGYVGACKRFQLFEWDAERGLTGIRYV